MNAKPQPIGGDEETAARYRNFFARYEERKTEWLAAHPDASPEDIEAAMRRIAEELQL